jgi:hypothetical protein
MIEKLQKCASGHLVLLLFIITIFVYMVILFYTIPAVTARAPEMRLFDMSPGGYTHAYAEKLLDAIGPEGRAAYLKQQLPIDFVYPGLFAVTYTLMLVWLFSKSFDLRSKVFLLALIPAAAGLFDYLENIGIIFMIKSFPDLNPYLVSISSTFSILKSLLTIASYFLLCFGFLSLFIKRVNIKTANK